MPNNWSTITISDLVAKGEAEIKTGPFGTQLHASDYVEEGTPVLNAGNVGFGDIRTDKLDFISAETVNRLSSHLLQPEDIIFGRKGTVERHAFIRDRHTNWFQGTDCLRLRLKSPSIEPRFVSYYFLTEYHKQWIMNQSSHGATMTSLNQAIIGRITFNLPPLPLQRKIIDILSAYDDLIENNTHRIHILEQMAQAIYEEWFGKVDKESLPKGWELDTLGNHIAVDRGVSHKGEYMKGEGLPLLNLKSFSIRGGYRTDGLKSYSGEYKPKHVVHAGDIVLANTDLTQAGSIVGNPVIVPNIEGEILFTHHLYAIRFRPDSYLMKYYLYHLLLDSSYKSFAKGRAIGTTVLGLAQDGVLSFEFTRPPKKLIEKFDEGVSPIYELKDSLEAKNANLRQTRDLLLPRLVSGEIEIK